MGQSKEGAKGWVRVKAGARVEVRARVSEEEDKLNLAILSGKGGTGKTTISTNLSLITGASYIDCDVEEPNGFIFLNPSQIKSRDVKVDYPVIDRSNVPYAGLVQGYASLMPW